MIPSAVHRFSLALAATLLTSCASGGGGSVASLPPASPEECARYAQGYGPTGISFVESFDSMYLAAASKPPAEQVRPDQRLEKVPALINGRSIVNLMPAAYPPHLLRAGRGGTTMVAVLVHADGTPNPVRVFRGSGDVDLDLASVAVGREMRFSPGIFRGCPVFTFVILPVNWVPGPPPQAR